MRRLRRLTLPVALAALAFGAPPALADLEAQRNALDARISRLEEQIEAAKQRERVLTSDIAAASERIEAVSAQAAELDRVVRTLEAELAEHRARLSELRALYAEQTRMLAVARQQELEARTRLEQRVVEIYQSGTPDAVEIVFSAASLGDLVSQLEYADVIASHDREIAESVERAKVALREARARTAAIRAEEARVTAELAARTLERRQAFEELVARRDQLVRARDDRAALLARIQVEREHAEEDLAQLEAASAELGRRLRAAQSGSGLASAGSGSAPSGGLAWPVSGPITSGFGQRWGRLHAGIDIGAGFGTPIRAAAAGTVVHAGWLGGYGNLVVIDHGAGLATAYAHQQAIFVSVGQQVGQGETIGEVGSTGNSTGPHLHFEVRVNGTPVDPLGYL